MKYACNVVVFESLSFGYLEHLIEVGNHESNILLRGVFLLQVGTFIKISYDVVAADYDGKQ